MELLVQIFDSCLVFTPHTPWQNESLLRSTFVIFSCHWFFSARHTVYGNYLVMNMWINVSPTYVIFQHVINISSIDKSPTLLSSHFLPISTFSHTNSIREWSLSYQTSKKTLNFTMSRTQNMWNWLKVFLFPLVSSSYFPLWFSNSSMIQPLFYWFDLICSYSTIHTINFSLICNFFTMASYYLPQTAQTLLLSFSGSVRLIFQGYPIYTSPSVLVSTLVLEHTSPNATFAPAIPSAYENRQVIFFSYQRTYHLLND